MITRINLTMSSSESSSEPMSPAIQSSNSPLIRRKKKIFSLKNKSLSNNQKKKGLFNNNHNKNHNTSSISSFPSVRPYQWNPYKYPIPEACESVQKISQQTQVATQNSKPAEVHDIWDHGWHNKLGEHAHLCKYYGQNTPEWTTGVQGCVRLVVDFWENLFLVTLARSKHPTYEMLLEPWNVNAIEHEFPDNDKIQKLQRKMHEKNIQKMKSQLIKKKIHKNIKKKAIKKVRGIKKM